MRPQEQRLKMMSVPFIRALDRAGETSGKMGSFSYTRALEMDEPLNRFTLNVMHDGETVVSISYLLDLSLYPQFSEEKVNMIWADLIMELLRVTSGNFELYLARKVAFGETFRFIIRESGQDGISSGAKQPTPANLVG